MRHVSLVALALASLAAVVAPTDSTADKYWPQWRGPHASGVSKTADPPVEWSETKNVKWKVEIPGRGSASPVVWGDRIFLPTAVPIGADAAASHAPRGGLTRSAHRFEVLAIDRASGRTIWERVAREAVPHEASHAENGTWASSSAITDGKRVFAWFESEGLYAYDMDGTLLWQADFGKKQMRMQFGEGSTPVLFDGRIVIVWDHQGSSFIVALDANTGKELWRVPRQEIDTWATPLVAEQDGRAQVIAPGKNRIRSYDLETGNVVWEAPGLTMNPIPSPVYGDGMVFAMSGFQGNRLRAIRLADAKGDLTGSSAEAWSLDRDTPYVPSPLLCDGILYFLKTNSGLLSAYDAKTGKPFYQLQRLDGLSEIFSSPVGASGRVYITGREGTTLVIKQGPTYEVIAKNALEDGFDASPALVGQDLYLRGHKYLYALSAATKP